MNLSNGLSTKTTIEHLIFLNQKSIVQVCRDLDITPQQFSDWIKKRRPVPATRLNALKEYFGVAESCLVDENNYAYNMSALTRIELEKLVTLKRLDQAVSEEDRERYEHTIDVLKMREQKQIRIARLSSILGSGDERVSTILDMVLDKLERGELGVFERLLAPQGGEKDVHSVQNKQD